MITRTFGLKKSPESKQDWNVKTILKKTQKLPDKVDLSFLCGPIRDQGDTGFCHSFAGTALKNIQENLEKNYQQNFSPLYLAKCVKEIDNMPNEEGSTLLNVCKALCETGVVNEVNYPFYKYKPGSLSFPVYNNTGYKYKIKNYARCTEVEEMKLALSLNKPVLLGIQCTPEIYDVTATNPFIQMPDKMISIGGHAVLIVGYDDTFSYNGHRGHFRIQNSWGEEWGDKGFAWLPYDYINYRTKDYGMRFLFMDAYTTIDLENDPLNETVVEMFIGNKTVKVNGEEREWSQAPIIDPVTWRTLVPLRDVFEIAGFAVLWDDATKKITLVKEG